MSFLLFLWFITSNKATMTTAHFADEQSCRNALFLISEAAPYINGECIPSGYTEDY